MMGNRKCPYCENESLKINENGRVDCETDGCNFQDKSKEEVIELRQGEYLTEHAETMRMMSQRDDVDNNNIIL